MIKKVEDANIDINKFYFDVIAYITTNDKHETDYYMLVKRSNKIDEELYEYIIRHGYQNGMDAWGWDYVCNKEDLYELIETYKDNNHPFVNAIKGYVKKLEHDKTLTLL